MSSEPSSLVRRGLQDDGIHIIHFVQLVTEVIQTIRRNV
jgi:hypothetical protein